MKDITTQNPEPEPKNLKIVSEKKNLYDVKILKLVYRQHPGVQQYHQRKLKQVKGV